MIMFHFTTVERWQDWWKQIENIGRLSAKKTQKKTQIVFGSMSLSEWPADLQNEILRLLPDFLLD